MSEPHLPFVAELDKDVFIKDAQEALELLVNYKYQGTDYMLVHSNNLPVDFFDLKTGLAGEILQKFSNYDGYLGIITREVDFESKSMNDFIRESNKTGRIVFAPNKESILKRWWPQAEK